MRSQDDCGMNEHPLCRPRNTRLANQSLVIYMTQTTGLRVYPGTIALGIQLEESIYCSSLEPEVDVIIDECTVHKSNNEISIHFGHKPN